MTWTTIADDTHEPIGPNPFGGVKNAYVDDGHLYIPLRDGHNMQSRIELTEKDLETLAAKLYRR
jgi:hypothetical protein